MANTGAAPSASDLAIADEETFRVLIARLLSVLAMTALLLVWLAAPALADHCGAEATMSPSSGPPGTTFVFRTNLGAPSDLRVYRNDHLVREVYLAGDDFVRYRIRTGSADAGQWRARAEVRGFPDCVAEASFSVVAPPDTSTLPGSLLPSARAATAAFVIVGALAALLAIVALGRREPS